MEIVLGQITQEGVYIGFLMECEKGCHVGSLQTMSVETGS